MQYGNSFCVKFLGMGLLVGPVFLGAMQRQDGLETLSTVPRSSQQADKHSLGMLTESQQINRGVSRSEVFKPRLLAQGGQQASKVVHSFGHIGAQCLSAVNDQGESKQTLLAEIKAVHLSRQNQVIAAWLQLNLAGEPSHTVRKLEEADWGLAGSLFVQRVSAIVRVLKQFVHDKPFCFSLYKQIYLRVASEDRIVPGGGNSRQVLLDPERLERKIGRNAGLAVCLSQANK